ncbi:hypothetical protein M409DRAFT_54108 [Zasmidium cellare ATCC 36951]|uniref:Uncharacterized protein n=1 Tax=Zasmidium cellare ATCC 36951 TaxID=1080233 RepID=A0A6A6CP36_ZASCE|nr:uncharacterized protein M409DRAFT_54108 [Zasmidium cellare ATCC 36951]KAF2167509.1 hypothetical protein M409DRAFT_54108 [Zasmidium cellare ATCC 36951]
MSSSSSNKTDSAKQGNSEDETTIREASQILFDAIEGGASTATPPSNESIDKASDQGKDAAVDGEVVETKAAQATTSQSAPTAGTSTPSTKKTKWKSIVPEPHNYTQLELDAIEGLFKMRYSQDPRVSYSPLTPPAPEAGQKDDGEYPFPRADGGGEVEKAQQGGGDGEEGGKDGEESEET